MADKTARTRLYRAMAFETRPHPTRIRLFRTAWIELTTLTPFPLFAMIWIPILGLVAWSASRSVMPSAIALSLLAGLVSWVLFEYAAHRFIFHFKPRTERGRRVIFLLHGNHHADPADPLRSIMPLTASVPLGLAVWWLYRIVMGAGIGNAVFLGFALGYVVYDTVHWGCHQLPMRGPIRTRLKRHHLRHHHTGESVNYAITAIFLDRVFKSGLNRR